MAWGKAKMVDIEGRGRGGEVLEMVDVAIPGPMNQTGTKEVGGEHVVDLKKQIEKSKKDAEDDEDEEVARAATLGDYVRIFSYCKRIDYAFLLAGAVAAIGAGITMPLMNVVFGEVVTDFSNAQLPLGPEQEAANKQAVKEQTERNTLYIVYLFLGKFFLTYIAMYSFRRVGTRLSARLRLEYLRALFSHSVAQLDALPSGTAASTITGKANTMQIGITDKLADLTQSSALIISAYAIAFKFSWQLTLAASSALVLAVGTVLIIMPHFMKMHKSLEQAQQKATSVASETVTAIRMITACGAADRMAARHKKWVDLSRERGLKESPMLGMQIGPIFFFAFGDYALTFWFGVRLYQQNHVDSVGEVMVVLLSVLMSVMAMAGIFGPLSSATKAASAAADFFEMIDMPIQRTDGWKDKYVKMNNDIRFENVTFAYPTRSHVKVLDNFSATFKKGKLTAIVGPSGSGKSTVVALLERWYNLSNAPLELPDPKRRAKEMKRKEKEDKKEAKKREKEAKRRKSNVSSFDSDKESDGQPEPEPIELGGSVKIGECDLLSVDMKFWRSHIGLVQQEPFVFNVSIYENVSYGLVGTEWEHADEKTKRELVKEACIEAYADEYISRLPEGYETVVGDSGMKLSGGQRQRLAIARAIVKQPSILIFDEATSSIDVRSERIVQAALDRVAKNRTTITIAHRLSTIKKADNILVMAKGKLVEQGTHDELLEIEDGVYAHLVNAQQIMMGGDSAEYDVEKNRWSTYDMNAPMLEDKEDEDALEDTDEDAAWKDKSLFKSFGKLVVENKKHWKWLALTVIGALGAGATMPVSSYIIASVISIFGDYADKTDPGLTRDSEKWALAFVGLACGIGLSYAIAIYSANELSVKVSTTYRQQYFEGVIVKPIPFFDAENNSTGSLVGRLSSDPAQLQELMGTNMGMMFVGMVSVVACASLALAIGWKLALVAMSAAIPITCTAGYYRFKYELTFEKMNAAVFLESSQFAAEAFSAIRTVTSLTLEDTICSRYEKLLYEHVRASESRGLWTILVFALSHSVNLLCMALTFWYGGTLIASGEYTLKQWFIIYASIIQSFESASQWMSFGPNMAQSTAAANRILSLREKGSAVKLPMPDIDAEGGVSIGFKDVSYNYAGRDMPVFKNLNLRIEKGQFAALVGPSGCGKSTIISLLERFYEVSSGSLTFDGKDVYGLDVAGYRRLLSLVAQEAALFQGSVRENILLGVEHATDAEIETACRSAEIWEFIMSLPQGLETDVGSKGVALSGGQKQRIAIARALIRNPQVLLLDEATSSLDSESERAIQGAFERAGKGRTMVVVAHRLATVQNADVIFVLGGGATGAKVLEKGNHQELLRKRGVYFQMCQSQALDR